MSRQNYESKFLASLKKSIYLSYPESSFWYKLPDDFKFKKPFDVITSFDSSYFAIEAKVHKSSQAWSFSKVMAHQIEGLVKADKGGFHALILLNVNSGKGKDRINLVFIIPINQFLIWINDGKKSISISELKEKCDFLEQKRYENCKELLWNLIVFT